MSTFYLKEIIISIIFTLILHYFSLFYLNLLTQNWLSIVFKLTDNFPNVERIAKEYECSENKIESHLISVNADQYAKEHFEKTVKKTITILDWQNTEGIRQGINFSKICQDALTQALIKNMQNA